MKTDGIIEEVQNRLEIGLITESQAERYINLALEKVSQEEKARRKKLIDEKWKPVENFNELINERKPRIEKRIERNARMKTADVGKDYQRKKKELEALKAKQEKKIFQRRKSKIDYDKKISDEKADAEKKKRDIETKKKILKSMNNRRKLIVDSNDKMYYQKNKGNYKNNPITESEDI